MAGNQMPVLTLDVNEEHLKRLEAIFEKYRNGLMIGPAGTPMKIPGQGGSRGRGTDLSVQTSSGRTGPDVSGRIRDENGRFIGGGKKTDSFVSNYKGRGETMFDKYLNSLGKNAQATLKTYKQINSTLYQTNSRLKTLFKTTVSWGTKIAAMGAVGPFGYGYMASKVAAQYSVAQGLGMTTAQMQAARSTYSPYFSGTEELVQHLANAQENPNDPNYSGLTALGINPKDGAATNLPKLISAVASLVKQYKGSGLTQSILQGNNLGLVDVAFANQVAANIDKIPMLNERYAKNTRLLGAYLTPAMQSDYQDTVSNLMVNGHRIFNAWQASMAGYNPLIRDTANGFTTAIETFLTGKNFKEILTDVKDGLENFGSYINGPNVNKDLNNFAANVAKVVKALGGFVGFAAEHPWLFGATMLVGPSALGAAGVAAGAAGSKIIPAVFPRSIIPGRIALARGLGWLQALVPYNDTPTTSEEMKGLDRRFKFEYFNEVQEWQKNNPGKVWPRKIGYDNNANLSQKEKLLAMVRAKARAALLPEGLMEAMIGVESGWNPNAISPKGAMGLPQFIKSTGNAYGLYGKDFYDPDKSTDAMVRYLIDNSNRYGGDIAKMLAQYNGGNAAVGNGNTLRLKLEGVDYLLKLLAQVPAMREQRPMLEGKLRNAQQVLASNPDGRALIQLEIIKKPGDDWAAQIIGQSNPRW
ncbi:lytic transglycosylase domain-containing protein [Salmonella enterica]|nr:transglycosylase SLT domain-containing protein [Salmonella enterica subsp. enterica serovar Hvittingfoss]EDH3335778.1 transglycosylase SLT domain-containing protein [Salmonella enterica]